MENKNRTAKKILIVLGVLLVTAATFLIAKNTNLLTSLLPTNTSSVVRGDLYIPQNYQANPGQQGEVEVRVGKDMSKIAGVQFTVTFPTSQLSVYDASVQGLPTGAFLIIKNTNDPGKFQVSMAQANGVDVAADGAVLKLSVNVDATVPAGSLIPLGVTNVSVVDENGTTLATSGADGKITVAGGTVTGGPYIQSVIPNYGSPATDTPIVIKLKNFEGSITGVKIGTTSLTGFAYVNGEVRVTVPSGLSAGVYNLIITDSQGGTVEKIGGFTVVDQADGLSVDEGASYFTPGKVKNDGAMTTTLWVKVDDLHGVEDIEYVDVNLENLGGVPSTRMLVDKIVDKSRWFYLSGIKVPPTVSTSNTPYPVTITATNKIGKVAKGMTTVFVIGDVESNIKPVVHQGYTIPPFIPNNGTTTFSVFVYVTDDDGADKLENVMIDLSQIGDTTKTMTKEGAAVGNGFWYKVDGVKVSPQIAQGTFQAAVTASNKTGDTGTGDVAIKVSNNVNVPAVSVDSYLTSPRVPADNTTTFSIYALVQDQDGADNIERVTVNFEELNIPPMELTKGASDGKGAWYEGKNLKVPTNVFQGIHQINIEATDKEGHRGGRSLDMEVIDPDQIKNAPNVETDHSYTTPVIVANDGSTMVNLYAFVSDPDGAADIESVNIDLREVGLKPVNKMLEDTTEGKGRWFKFTTKIPPIIAPSTEGYQLQVSATDKSGAVDTGMVVLKISDLNPSSVLAPQIEAAVAISATKLEIIFNKDLDTRTINSVGDNFSIKDRSDVKKILRVKEATINTKGNIVILTTDTQEENKPFTVQVDKRVTDSQGTTVRVGNGDKSDFRGFKPSDKTPVVKLLTPTSPTTIELEFWEPIRPSSVALDGSDFSIFEVTNSREGIEVQKVNFKDESTLILTTEDQKYGVPYGITLRNIASRAGVALSEIGIEQFFKGFITPLVGDLNFDKKVDFNDFTIFADAYRKAQGYNGGSPTTVENPNANKNLYLPLVPADTSTVTSNNSNSSTGNSNSSSSNSNSSTVNTNTNA